MYISMQCPHCGRRLKIAESKRGSGFKCPDCRERIEYDPLASPPDPGGPEAGDSTMFVEDGPGSGVSSQAQSEGGEFAPGGAAGSDVSVWVTGLLGVLATAAFYYLVIPQLLAISEEAASPLRRAGVMLADSWVPKAIVFLSAWSVAILIGKFLKIQKQRRALLYDILPREIAPRIRPGGVAEFMTHLRGLPVKSSGSYLIQRVQRGLAHFRSRGSQQEVATLLTAQGDLDADAVDSSYTMLRVFIWAVPILGFIGTVLGISDAVGTFSSSIASNADMAIVKDSLGGVTSGLGTAFNTTLIALVVSILLMLPMNWLQKLEGDVLTAVGDYCNEEFLLRLEEAPTEVVDAGAVIRSAMASALAEQQACFRDWQASLNGLGSTLAADVARGWQEVHGVVGAQMESHVDAVRAGVKDVLALQAEQQNQWLEQLRQSAAQTQEDAVAQWTSAQAGLIGEVSGLREALAQALTGQIAQVEQARDELVELREVRQAIERSATAMQSAHEAALKAQAATADEVLSRILAGFDAQRAETHTLQEGLHTRLQGSAEGLQTAVEAVRGAADATADALTTVRTGMDAHGQALAARLGEACGDHVEAVAAQLKGVVAEIKALGKVVTSDVPKTMAQQQQVLQAQLAANRDLVAQHRKLVDQLALINEDVQLPRTLVGLRKALQGIEKRLGEKKPGRLRSLVFGRNGSEA